MNNGVILSVKYAMSGSGSVKVQFPGEPDPIVKTYTFDPAEPHMRRFQDALAAGLLADVETTGSPETVLSYTFHK